MVGRSFAAKERPLVKILQTLWRGVVTLGGFLWRVGVVIGCALAFLIYVLVLAVDDDGPLETDGSYHGNR